MTQQPNTVPRRGGRSPYCCVNKWGYLVKNEHCAEHCAGTRLEQFRAELTSLLDRYEVRIGSDCCVWLVSVGSSAETARENVEQLNTSRLDWGDYLPAPSAPSTAPSISK